MDTKTKCIKCDNGVGHDARGWEEICIDPYADHYINICPNCILDTQAVIDKFGFKKCEKCKKEIGNDEYFKCTMEHSPHPTQHFVCFDCFNTYILTTAG